MRRNETTIEKLRYRFTPEEHLKNAEHLASKFHEAGEMKQTHEAIKANLAEQKKTLEAELGKYARLVSDGFDIRDVQCRWDYGRPSGTQKTLVRLDTEIDVRTEMMLDHERQEVIKFEEASHILSGPGALRGRKVNSLDRTDIDYFSSRDEADLLRFGWLSGDILAVFAEARRRAEAEVPATGPQLVPDPETPSTADAAAASSEVHESGIQFVNEAEAAEAEAPHTLPSVSEIDGGTHAQAGVKRGRKRGGGTGSIAPLTEEERAHLEAVQSEVDFWATEPQDETPELEP